MRSTRVSNWVVCLLLCLPITRCSTYPASLPSAADEVLREQAASQAVERYGGVERSGTRFFAKLWTLCDPLEPERGFCLSLMQAREILIRMNEDRAHFRRVVIDQEERAGKAEARLGGAIAEKDRVILFAVSAGILLLLGGVGVGIGIGALAF